MKIVSGGQTGVDRAALDFAMANGLEHGGWCPRGRLAEDGVIPLRYALTETDTTDYAERTERNVLDSDATVIVTRTLPLAGGTLLTEQCARKHGKPSLTLSEQQGAAAGAAVAQFLNRHSPFTLNVAGPRESEAPGIGRFVREVLAAVLSKA